MHNTQVKRVVTNILHAAAMTSLYSAGLLGAAAIGFYGVEIITADMNLNLTRAYDWKTPKNVCIGGSLVALSSFLGSAFIGAAIHQDEDD